MKVTVKLFATLRKNNVKEQMIELDEGTTLEDIVDELNITKDEVSIIMINGRGSKVDTILKDGDVISLFPTVGGG